MISKGIKIEEPDKIIDILANVTAEGILVEVVFLPAKTAFASFFTCKKSNLARRDSLYVITQGFEEAFAKSPLINIGFQYRGSKVDLDTTLMELVEDEESHQTLARLQFPKLLYQKTVRQFSRHRIPPHLELPLSVRHNKSGLDVSCRVIELGEGGISFEMDKAAVAKARELVAGQQVMLSIYVEPEAHNSFDIPISSVIRRVNRVRSEDGGQVLIVGAEFMLVAQGYKGKLHNLILHVEEENARYERFGQSVNDAKLAECLQYGSGFTEVLANIQKANPEELLALLFEHYENDPLVEEIIGALLQHPKTEVLIQAFNFLHGLHQDVAGKERLFQALLARANLRALIGLCDFFHDGCVEIEEIARTLAEKYNGKNLLEALAALVDKPEAQALLVDAFLANSNSSVLRLGITHLKNNRDGLTKVTAAICGMTDNIAELTNTIISVRRQTNDPQHPALFPLARDLVRFADVPTLLDLMSKYFSDHSMVGEMIVAGIIRQRNVRAMVFAFRHMSLNSMSSLMLAHGVVKYGSPVEIAEARDAARHCPQALTILEAKLTQLEKDSLKNKLMGNRAPTVSKEVVRLYLEAQDYYTKLIERIEKGEVKFVAEPMVEPDGRAARR